MTTRFIFPVLASFTLLFSSVAEDTPPQLLIDPGGHAGAVKRLLFRPDVGELISLGDDKTIRFWDLESGELLRTVRGEIGEGNEGKLFAGALSLDGRFLAVAGFDAGHTIRILDLKTGEIAAVLRGHEDSIHSLDFSDDGRWLASGSSDTGVRVWDLSTLVDAAPSLSIGKAAAIEIDESQLLEGHSDSVYALDFASDGLRLVSGADDDLMIFWKRETVEEPFVSLLVNEEHEGDVSAAAFSVGDFLLVTGGYDNCLILWDGETGEYMETIDEDMGNSVTTLTFSPDGQRVLASSQTAGSGTTAIYDLETNARSLEFPLHKNTVRCLAWHPELNLIASSGGNNGDIFLWHPDADEEAGVAAGDVAHHLLSVGRTAWAVAYSDDSSPVISFGQTESDELSLIELPLDSAFDFDQFDLVDPVAATRTLTEVENIVLSKTDDHLLTLGEDDAVPVDAGTDGTIRAFSLTPDGAKVLVGSDFSLSAFSTEADDEGDHELLQSFIGHASTVWALSPSPDGTRLATVSGDQTLRLWNLETGELLASLFVATDQEWVCWTPSGHYQASPGGEQYIGWHFNRGIDRLGEFFPSYVFRDTFHHPELVRQTVLLGSHEAALAAVGAEPVEIDTLLPPQIEWVTPTEPRGTLEGTETTVQAQLSSPNGNLQELKLLLNGKAIHHYELSDGTEFTYEETITLNPGENRLTLFASNIHAGHTSEERILHVPTERTDSAAPDKPTAGGDLDEILKPNLYMLAVGVSDFVNGDISALEYCDDDATAMAEFFAGQEGGLFAKTEIKLLVNGDATESAIQEGLDWLEKSATQKDFVVLFLASHGCNDEKGNFYMIPHDCDPANLRSTGVAWEDFGDVLGNLPSRVLMFLDTCHSGRLGANLFTMANGGGGTKTRSFGGLKSPFDNSEAIRELTSDEVGVVIMAASTGNESSLENPEWGHGAFTAGVLAGLGGEGDLNGDGIVHLVELDFFVSEKVKELTEGAQHPTTVKPSTISRLPVAAVVE